MIDVPRPALRYKPFRVKGLSSPGAGAFGSVGGGAAATVVAGAGAGAGGGTGTVTDWLLLAGSPETASGVGGTGGGPAGSLGVCAALSVTTKSPTAQIGRRVRPAIRVVLVTTECVLSKPERVAE
jgi:hypothetical protein